MGVSAAIGIAAVVIGGTEGYVAIDNAHAATNRATDMENKQQDAANKALTDANNAEKDRQDKSAASTAVAQARVRSISNPDGNSIMTSPLGQAGSSGSQSPGGSPPTQGLGNQAPGMATPTTKSTLGG